MATLMHQPHASAVSLLPRSQWRATGVSPPLGDEQVLEPADGGADENRSDDDAAGRETAELSGVMERLALAQEALTAGGCSGVGSGAQTMC